MSTSPRSRATRVQLAAFAIAAAAAVSLTGCASAARFETTGGGHAILATVDGPHTIDSREASVTITNQSGTVTVERDRARIAGGPWERIPEQVPVRITMSKGRAAIRVGSITISRATR